MPLARVVGLTYFTQVELDADGNVERRIETPRGETVDVDAETLARGVRKGWLDEVDDQVAQLEGLAVKELHAIAARAGLHFERTATKADKIAAIRAATPAAPDPAGDGLDGLSDDELLERAVILDVEPGDDRDETIAVIRAATSPPAE